MAEAGCPALTLPNQFGEEWWWMPEAVSGNERSLPVIEKCGGSGANQNPYSTRFWRGRCGLRKAPGGGAVSSSTPCPQHRSHKAPGGGAPRWRLTC